MEAALAERGGAPPNLRVLVIDDDTVDRERCVRYINQFGGASHHTILSVENTAAADNILLQEQVDCIIVDFQLEDETGLDFASRHVRNEDPPIILLTGHGADNLVLSAMRIGVADYLEKSTLTASALRRSIHHAVERHALHNSVRRNRDEVVKANCELTRRNTEIQNFYHAVSHELKTPLTAAREFICLIRDGIAGPVNEQQVELLTHAVECCDQLTLHFNDLVESTRLETGKLTLKPKPVDLRKILIRSLVATEHLAESRGVNLRKSISRDLPLVNIDEGRIMQVLANLLTNAIKFTPRDGYVRVSAKQISDRSILVSVRDTGCGIPQPHIERIFDRLYQVPREGSELATSGGLGLGLSIAKEIVALHGSDLRVSSVVGVGSDFQFLLPVAQDVSVEVTLQ